MIIPETQPIKDAQDRLQRSIRMLDIHVKDLNLTEAEKDMALIEQRFAQLKAVLSNVS